MKCPTCGKGSIVCKCENCGDVRCNMASCPGSTGGSKVAAVNKGRCKACKKGVYRKIS